MAISDEESIERISEYMKITRKWVSVKDRLPKDYHPVLVFVPKPRYPNENECRDDVRYLMQQCWHFGIDWCENGGFGENNGDVTHWQSMPLKPKGYRK